MTIKETSGERQLPHLSQLVYRFNQATLQATEQLIGLLKDKTTVENCFHLRKELLQVENLISTNRLSPSELEQTAKALVQTIAYIQKVQLQAGLGLLPLETKPDA